MVSVSVKVTGFEDLDLEEDIRNGIEQVIKTVTMMQSTNLKKGVYEPVVDIVKRTGNLGKWYMRFDDYTGIVYSDVIYSIYLDKGTRYIEPRHFMDKAILKTQQELNRITINV